MLPLIAALGAAAQPATTALPTPAELPARPELPDPLVTLSGRKVATPEEWRTVRRPELKRLFEHYMYGAAPPPPRKVEAEVLFEDRRAFGLAGTLREVRLTFGPPGTPAIHLLVAIPNRRSGRVGVFVGPNFGGNHAAVYHPSVRIPDGWMYGNRPGVVNNRATEQGRGRESNVWNVPTILERGYALAIFYNGDLEPDVNGTPDGIRARWRDRYPEADWGAIRAWAWGISRCVDYLRTQPELDPRRIAAVGHSRNGKAAMVAAAFDERIAMAIPNQAGCGGTAPSRGTVGESVERINTSFPHWFNGLFKQFNGRPQHLPFDQHCLVALAAPRPVLFPNAEEDTWANPAGQFEVLRAADPVYRFLGAEGLGQQTMPPSGVLLKSRLGYFIRPGKHSMTLQEWQAYLDFADAHLK